MPAGPARLTEEEENTLRVLIPKIRNTDPALFITMLMDAAINRIVGERVIVWRKTDDAGQTEAMLALFHGPATATEAERLLVAARQRTEPEKPEDPPKGA